MGGFGSGNRWRHGTRDTCEASKRIDIRYMRSKDMLRPGSQGSLSWNRNGQPNGSINYRMYEAAMVLDYRTRPVGGDWVPVIEHIAIDKQEQPYGGSRRFFRCPRCNRRCLVLYGDTHFRCRKCQNLAYASQNGDGKDRADLLSRKIRERLGGAGGWDDVFPAKPKGMHWSTYARLAQKSHLLERRVEMHLVGLLDRLLRFGSVRD